MRKLRRYISRHLLNQLATKSRSQTTPMINECFGTSVTSVAMDGAAPELNPGWVHRRKNTYPEVRYAQYVCITKRKVLSILCARRTALVSFFPQRDFLSRFGRFAIHGVACHETSAVLIDLGCCLQVCSTALEDSRRTHIFAAALVIHTAIVQTTKMINGCFGISVTSVAMDGAAPELNPGWVHRRKNTYPEVRHSLDKQARPPLRASRPRSQTNACKQY